MKMPDWRRSGWSIVPIIAVTLALYLLAQCASAFTPCRNDVRVRLTLIESPLPWLDCAAIAGGLGGHLAALGMMVSPSPACAVWNGVAGWIVAVPGAPDWVLGREVRHAVWGEGYAVPAIPIFKECKQ